MDNQGGQGPKGKVSKPKGSGPGLVSRDTPRACKMGPKQMCFWGSITASNACLYMVEVTYTWFTELFAMKCEWFEDYIQACPLRSYGL